MDRLVILSNELKKYFIMINEKRNSYHTMWRCNIDECTQIIQVGKRIRHLKHNHITKFFEIDQKLPSKNINKRPPGSILSCTMCGTSRVI